MIRSQGHEACLHHSRKKQFLMAWTYLLHSSFHFFTYSPCVSVICTVSFKGVKEINSNSPFPLLIKVMARKNGRQYQFIYHKLSISSYAATDSLLVGLLICSWHYFCFQAALMKMKELLCLALLIKDGFLRSLPHVLCHEKGQHWHQLLDIALSLRSTPSHFPKSAYHSFIVYMLQDVNWVW